MIQPTTTIQAGAAFQAPAKPKPVDLLKMAINEKDVQQQIQDAVGKNAGSFITSILELFSGDSKLQRCEPKRVIWECLKAASLRLPISKTLGFAFVIAYKSRAKFQVQNPDGSYREVWDDVYTPNFQIGYKGLIQLAMRTGQYRTINADVVYEGELRKGSKLTGIYDFDGEKKSDKIIGYFCYFELLNGFNKTLYMSVEAMAAHAKQYSKALAGKDITVEHLLNLANLPMRADSNNLGWLGNFHGMAIKTTIRNLLSKYGYLSVEMEKAFDYEAESDEKAIEIGTDHQIQAYPMAGSDGGVIDMETTSFEDLSNQVPPTPAPQFVKPQEDEIVIPY